MGAKEVKDLFDVSGKVALITTLREKEEVKMEKK